MAGPSACCARPHAGRRSPATGPSAASCTALTLAGPHQPQDHHLQQAAQPLRWPSSPATGPSACCARRGGTGTQSPSPCPAGRRWWETRSQTCGPEQEGEVKSLDPGKMEGWSEGCEGPGVGGREGAGVEGGAPCAWAETGGGETGGLVLLVTPRGAAEGVDEARAGAGRGDGWRESRGLCRRSSGRQAGGQPAGRHAGRGPGASRRRTPPPPPGAPSQAGGLTG